MSQAHPGAGLGLPAAGPGSLASFQSRTNAFVLDCLIAALVAFAFTAPQLPQNWSLLPFAVLYVASTVLVGQTLGMRVLGIRLAQSERPGSDPGGRIGPVRAVVRTALLMLVVPALFRDGDGRGWHDRASGTAVVYA